VLFGMMIWLRIRFIVPVLGVFWHLLIADEVDDKTLTYLFTRPIPRAAVLSAASRISRAWCCWSYLGGADLTCCCADRRHNRRGVSGAPGGSRCVGHRAHAYGAVFAFVGPG
jgi:hypothetical protein